MTRTHQIPAHSAHAAGLLAEWVHSHRAPADPGLVAASIAALQETHCLSPDHVQNTLSELRAALYQALFDALLEAQDRMRETAGEEQDRLWSDLRTNALPQLLDRAFAGKGPAASGGALEIALHLARAEIRSLREAIDRR